MAVYYTLTYLGADMRTYLINNEFEITALNLESAYEAANEMEIEIVQVVDITSI